MERYKAELQLHNIKEIFWETAIVLELTHKAKNLQWWPQADPAKIRHKAAKEIIVEALCINFGHSKLDDDVMTFEEAFIESEEPAKNKPIAAGPDFDAAVERRAQEISHQMEIDHIR